MAEKEMIKTKGTPKFGATKSAQLLLRRKSKSQWEQYDQTIPFGEPCFSYDVNTGDYILKIGSYDKDNNLQISNNLNFLRGRVDDGDLD